MRRRQPERDVAGRVNAQQRRIQNDEIRVLNHARRVADDVDPFDAGVARALVWHGFVRIMAIYSPGSPKTKLCPFVVGNPLYGSS